jgi:eukaryotic-like serine/threonine-protein kinase
VTDDALTRSAERIADGREVDWDALRHEQPALADRLAALGQVERVARAWRAVAPLEPQAAPEEPALFRWGALEARERIGEGGFGEVFRAWDPALRREVALKLRRGGPDDAGTRRALEEARRLARVRHPNVLAVHGTGTHDGRAGLWTDLVRGRTLERELAERGMWGAREAAAAGCDLCRALAAVHAAGLVHGDVKAANVMREEGGRIVLMDFGSGHERDAGGAPAIATTPLAAAPELLEGAAPTPAADVYALGVLLFRLVTGRHPVEAASLDELRARHARGERLALRTARPELPTALVAAIERALERVPARRFADVGAFELALAGALADAAPADRRAVPVGDRVARALTHGVAVVMVAATGWAMWLGPQPASDAPASVLAPFPAPAPAVPTAVAAAPGGTAPAPAPPRVTATLWRGRDGLDGVLADGDAVRPGDHLWLEFEGDEPLHVYVLDEDARGETFALFPIPGTALVNPLPAGRPQRLPGTREGAPFDWVVTSAGGGERLLIVASRRPLAALEQALAAVPAAADDRPVAYAEVSGEALAALRGIGGTAPAESPARAGRLAAVERALAARRDDGLWVRHLTLSGH